MTGRLRTRPRRRIEVWSFGGPYYEDRVADFRERYPDLTWDHRPLRALGGYYLDALVKELQKPWTPLALVPVRFRDLGALIRRGWLRALDDFLPPQTRRAYAAPALDLGRRHGVLYAAPEDFVPYSLLAHTGASRSVPGTWAELEHRLDNAAGQTRTPMLRVQHGGPTHRYGFLLALLGSNGSRFDLGLESMLQDREGPIACYEWTRRMIAKGHWAYPADLHPEKIPTMGQFRERRLTYVLGWATELTRWTPEELNGVRVLPFPRGPARKPAGIPFNGTGWCVPHNTAHLDLAQELLATLTDPDRVREQERLGGTAFPALRQLWNDPQILARKPFYRDAAKATDTQAAYAPEFLDRDLQLLDETFFDALNRGESGADWLARLSRASHKLARQTVTHGLVRRALEVIEERLERIASVREIAASVGRHPDYLNRVFRKELGIGVKTYFDRRRMERARAMLADITLSIREIAERTGFASPAAFSRACRAHWGASPLRLRRQDLVRIRRGA